MRGRALFDQVNVLAGTDSHHGFSTGNTLPIAAVPFGLTHWSVQTAKPSWFFNPHDRKFQGFRATHQPSPWMGDYGSLTFMPLGEAPRLDPDGRSSSYEGTFEPDGIEVLLHRYQISAELTPTRSGCFVTVNYAHPSNALFVIESLAGKTFIEASLADQEVRVKSSHSAGGTPEGLGCYYILTFSAAFDVVDETDGRLTIRFRNAARVAVKVGSSFIGFDQVRLNLSSEMEDLEAATKAWLTIFDRFEIDGRDSESTTTFANCLYRANLFPRETHEFDASGQAIHYSFFSGKVESGVAVTDNGFWDTYRTIVPWINLTNPSRSSLALNGWVAALNEGGWFPQWASPGYRACMVGTHIDVVIADAVVKGIRDFDVEAAFNGMLKHATQPGDAAGSYGRLGIADYLAKGFVFDETVEGSVARSLDYAFDDFCIAQVAGALGKGDVAANYMKSAQNYRHLYDPSVGFMRARHGDGSWAHFREFEWGGPYVEGGPWQSSFAVPHDVPGMIELFGGKDRFVSKLAELLAIPPHFEIGHYGFEIHEMTEMAQADFGQYAHSNQPVHHILYLFAEAGRPDLGHPHIRRTMSELYTPDDFPGDEDNGEMAAWYLWSSIGLFPLTPGTPEYVHGAPLFEHAQVTLESGAEIKIESTGWSAENSWVVAREVNGVTADSHRIRHDVLTSGATIRSTYGKG